MTAKQHHYLPQTYLKGFASDEKNKERTYTYHSKTKKITLSKISEICSQNKLYEVVDQYGKPSDEVENAFFAQKIEPIFNQLMETIRKRQKLSNPEIADLSIYIALQMLRLPSTLRLFEDMYASAMKKEADKWFSEMLDDEKRTETLRKYKRNHPDVALDFTREDIYKYFDGTGIKLTPNIPKNNIIKASLSLSTDLANMLLRRKWMFIFSPHKTAFITGDMPVVVMVPNGNRWERMRFGGFGLSGAMILFPLAKDVSVLVQEGEYDQYFLTGNKQAVQDMNEVITDGFEHYLISHSEKLLARYTRRFEDHQTATAG